MKSLLLACAIATGCTACLPTGDVGGLWRAPIADMPFEAGQTSGGVAGSDGLFVMGGYYPQLTEMPLARLDLHTFEWSSRAALVSTAGSRVIGGGTVLDSVPYACVFETDLASNSLRCAHYDSGTNIWVDVQRPPSVFEQSFLMSALDGLVYLTLSQRTLVLDPTTSTWTEGPSLNFSTQTGVLVAHDGKLYRFSARAGFGSNELEVLDPVAGVWQTLAPPPDDLTLEFGGVSLGGRIWLHRADELITFDPADGSYADVVKLRASRPGTSLVGGADTLFVAGGNDPGGAIGIYLRTIEGFTP